MATTRKFAYNTGSQITGATQYGSLAIGVTLSSFSDNPGGVKWWGGPDEDLGYVIAHTVPSGNQPNPNGLSCSVGFWRTNGLNDQNFLTLVRQTTGQSFLTASIAATWLKTNGYWTSWVESNNIDLDAQAFFTATGITDTTQKTAVNTLVTSLKSYNIWTKMKAIYPFVGGTATTHKFNLKDPRDLDVAFRLQFNGGMTHSSTGVLPNGTNGYANTFFVTAAQITNGDSFHYSFYSRTNLDTYGADIGAEVTTGAIPDDYGTSAIHVFYVRYPNTNSSYARCGVGSDVGFGDTDTLGFYLANRNSIGKLAFLKNGLSPTLGPISNNPLISFAPMLLMAKSDYYPDVDPNSWSPYPGKRQLAFSTIGTGLTDTDSSNLYTSIQAFQTTLGRQV
jgi:hypothetical protein